MTATPRTPCPAQCRGGQPCACMRSSYSGQDKHTLHLCSDPACACHQPAAYGLVRAQGRDGAERYVRAGHDRR